MDNPGGVLVGVLTGVIIGISCIQGLVIYPMSIYLPFSKFYPGVDKTLNKGVQLGVIRLGKSLYYPIITICIKHIAIGVVFAGYSHHITVKTIEEGLYGVIEHHKLIYVYEEKPVKLVSVLFIEFGVCK